MTKTIFVGLGITAIALGIIISLSVANNQADAVKSDVQKAIDKSFKALEKACEKITKERTKLENIPIAIPIEILELELRACEPIIIPPP